MPYLEWAPSRLGMCLSSRIHQGSNLQGNITHNQQQFIYQSLKLTELQQNRVLPYSSMTPLQLCAYEHIYTKRGNLITLRIERQSPNILQIV
jgi:hypothetical protein